MLTRFAPLLAGMPMVTLSDVARPRIDAISFFLLGLLLSAGVVMLVWNSLRRDFAWLPRLSYAKACGIVVLWGLLFIVVLTMISGARELMTPGAWEKQGLTYKLRPDQPDPAPSAELASRRDRLTLLGQALRTYAGEHEGRFPPSLDQLPEAGTARWELPGLPGTKYIYFPGRRNDGPPVPLAYEPQVYDDDPLVLLTDGRIEARQPADIAAAMAPTSTADIAAETKGPAETSP